MSAPYPAGPAVYLLECQGLYKIGVSDNVRKRLAQIRTGSPADVELIHAMPTNNPYGLEGYLHRQYANKRARGEWFSLSPADVRTICGCRLESLPPEARPHVAPVQIGDETLYTLAQVAEGFGVHYQTAKGWAAAGRMKAVRIGRAYRVTGTEVSRLLTQSTGEPAKRPDS